MWQRGQGLLLQAGSCRTPLGCMPVVCGVYDVVVLVMTFVRGGPGLVLLMHAPFVQQMLWLVSCAALVRPPCVQLTRSATAGVSAKVVSLCSLTQSPGHCLFLARLDFLADTAPNERVLLWMRRATHRAHCIGLEPCSAAAAR